MPSLVIFSSLGLLYGFALSLMFFCFLSFLLVLDFSLHRFHHLIFRICFLLQLHPCLYSSLHCTPTNLHLSKWSMKLATPPLLTWLRAGKPWSVPTTTKKSPDLSFSKSKYERTDGPTSETLLFRQRRPFTDCFHPLYCALQPFQKVAWIKSSFWIPH